MIILSLIASLLPLLPLATHAPKIAEKASKYYEFVAHMREQTPVQFRDMSDEQYAQYMQLRELNKDCPQNVLVRKGTDVNDQNINEFLLAARIPTTMETMAHYMSTKPAILDRQHLVFLAVFRLHSIWERGSVWYHKDNKTIVGVNFYEQDEDAAEQNAENEQPRIKAILFSYTEQDGKLSTYDFFWIKGELPTGWE